MGLRDELDRLRKEAQTTQERPTDPEARERMRAVLNEVADARRSGRPLSPEALAIGEAVRERRARGA